MNNYVCFGLKIQSEIECPNLVPWIDDSTEPDIQIEVAKVDIDRVNCKPVNGYAWVGEKTCFLEIPSVARFAVHDGHKIIIDPLNSGSPSKIQAYLMGTAMGVLIHQRSDIPMHVSAVENSRGKAVAFAGPSGAGKSTIAAYIARETDLHIITDDVLRISLKGSSGLHVANGPRNLKLWDDACRNLQFSTSAGIQDCTREKKFHFHIPTAESICLPELESIVLLARSGDNGVELEQVYGEDHMRIIAASIYRSTIGSEIQGGRQLLEKCGIIANRTSAFVLKRPRSLADLGKSTSFLKNRHLI